MRGTACLLAVLLVLPLLGSDSPKEYDEKTEIAGIEGKWRVTNIEKNDGTTRLDAGSVWTYWSDTFAMTAGDGETMGGKYRIDLTSNPRHLDWTFTTGGIRGTTIKCIYQIGHEGDSLRVAYSTIHGTKRPQGFGEAGLCVFSFKRVK
jgi:uncharacterized protein (TIGR03067 family)